MNPVNKLSDHEHEVWMKTYEASLGRSVLGEIAIQRADEALAAYRKYTPDSRSHDENIATIAAWLALYHAGQNERVLVWGDDNSGPSVKLMIGPNCAATFTGDKMFDEAAAWCRKRRG